MAKRKRTEFIHFNTVKAYIKDVLDMNAGKRAVAQVTIQVNAAVRAILKEAKQKAKKEKKKTILERHIIAALEKHLGRKNLSWDEIAEEVLRQQPSELGKISNAIETHIRKTRIKL